MKPRLVFSLCVLSILALAGVAPADDMTASQKIQTVPNLVGFWDFSEVAGQPRVSTGTPTAHALQEQNGPIARVAEGPISGSSAYLDGADQFFRILHQNTGDLNISGPDAQVSMVAFIRQTRMSKTIAGMWSEGSGAYDDSGVRQYALLQDMPTYGGDDRVTPHISATGGVSGFLPWNADYAISDSAVAVDEWVSVGFTYDGTWVRAYYNGVCEQWDARPSYLHRDETYFTQGGPDGGWRGANPYYQPDGIYTFDPNDPNKLDTGAPFTVGARQAVGQDVAEPFEGYFGGLAVFDRALTEAEMAGIHNAADLPGPAARPRHFWEHFGHDAASDNVSVQSFNTDAGANWQTAWGPTAQSTSAVTSGEGIRIGNSNTPVDYYLAFVEGGQNVGFAWTEEISVSSNEISALSVEMNNSKAADVVRFAVLLDGRWYATADGLSMDADGASYNTWAATAELFEWQWSSTAADWLELDVQPGSLLALGGSPSDDLVGVIEGVGVFGELADGSVIRLNDLQVIAPASEVPEPTALVLFATGGLAVLRRRR